AGRVPMQRQPRGATRALRLPAALSAQERRREAPPVDEDERLFVASETLPERCDQFLGQSIARPRGTIRDESKQGKRRPRIRAPWKREQAIASRLRVHEGLERRRRAAEDDGNAALAGTPHRNVTRLVANAILLLERSVVLFVDHDQREC